MYCNSAASLDLHVDSRCGPQQVSDSRFLAAVLTVSVVNFPSLHFIFLYMFFSSESCSAAQSWTCVSWWLSDQIWLIWRRFCTSTRTSWFIRSAETRRETSSMDTTRSSHGKHCFSFSGVQTGGQCQRSCCRSQRSCRGQLFGLRTLVEVSVRRFCFKSVRRLLCSLSFRFNPLWI